LPDAGVARRLFDFAAVAWPEPTPRAGTALAFCWGAHAAAAAGERLVGAVLAERAERAAMLHGPVVAVDTEDALEVAAQLVAAALDHASALGVETVFARPQGLDRIWIRYGFIPVPEGALPAPLGVRQSIGLYAWRGGTALWTFRGSIE
jgi:predicted N-acetyltransferase YhbS